MTKTKLDFIKIKSAYSYSGKTTQHDRFIFLPRLKYNINKTFILWNLMMYPIKEND